MTDLGESYAWCRQVSRQSKSSFFSSFALLERPRRQAMYALYAFSRISDDLSDDLRPVRQRQLDLQRWRQQLEELETQTTRVPSVSLEEYSPLWPALLDTIQRYGIPKRLLLDIIRGVAMDLQPRQPKNWSELDQYCYHVASAVGLACTHIWGKTNHIPEREAIDCGIAFQLTNILRDIAEDARQGRIYLPDELFDKHGVSRARWLACRPDGDWQPMLMEVAERADALYVSGWKTIYALTPDSQRMFSLMWRSYRALLDDVIEHKQRLWRNGKVHLSRVRKALLLSTHFVSPLYANLREPSLAVKGKLPSQHLQGQR